MANLRLTTVCFQIGAVLYFILAAGLAISAVALLSFSAISWISSVIFFIIAILCLASGIFIEYVIHYLKKGKYWAWIAGIIISAFFLASIFFILGVFALIGLLSEETRARFRANLTAAETNQSASGLEYRQKQGRRPLRH